jgi:hypothetical protein
MGTRLELQVVLEDLLGSDHVYFQPPSNIQMIYPAIVYNRDYREVKYADNLAYSKCLRYQVTIINRDPDSDLFEKVCDLPLSTFVRHFAVDQLNHDIFDVYF